MMIKVHHTVEIHTITEPKHNHCFSSFLHVNIKPLVTKMIDLCLYRIAV